MFDGIPLGDLSAPVLVGIAFLLVMFGRLVPWWLYKEKCKEADNWKAAYEKANERGNISEARSAEMLEAVKITNDILYAMFDITTEDSRPSGGRHRVVPTSQ